MPNTCSMIVGPLDALGGAFVGKVGISVTTSNGKTATVTRNQLLTNYQSQTGTKAQKHAATIAWLKTQAESVLGTDQVPALNITFDFDDTDGTPKQLEVVG